MIDWDQIIGEYKRLYKLGESFTTDTNAEISELGRSIVMKFHTTFLKMSNDKLADLKDAVAEAAEVEKILLSKIVERGPITAQTREEDKLVAISMLERAAKLLDATRAEDFTELELAHVRAMASNLTYQTTHRLLQATATPEDQPPAVSMRP